MPAVQADSDWTKHGFHLNKRLTFCVLLYSTWNIEIQGGIQLDSSWTPAVYTLFLPEGGEIELIFALRGTVSEIWACFQNWHIWARNLAICQSARSCTYTVSLPQGGEIDLILALRAAASEIWADFQNCHFWACNLAICQRARSCTYTVFLPQGGRNWAYFSCTGSGFRDTGWVSKLSYLGMKLGN